MTAPEECPRLQLPIPCAIGLVETGAKLVPKIEQCSRCGWVDPASLDRYAELGYKRALTPDAQRIALAASGEPFTFVQSRGEVLSVTEAIAQALAASSMLGDRPDHDKAQRILSQLRAFVFDLVEAERAEAVASYSPDSNQ